MKNYILHLTNPATEWENASPVGAGSLGLMVFGSIAEERLVLNEETIWAGGPIEPKVEGFLEKITHVRQLFLNESPAKAEKWMIDNMDDCFRRIKSFEYAGELHVKLHDDDSCENYRRDIDLMNGLCTVEYEKSGASYKREYFASYPAKLICGRFTSDVKFCAEISYRRENIVSLTYLDDYIVVKSKTDFGDNGFSVYTKIKTDGEAKSKGCAVEVTDASYVEIYTGIFTEFKFDDIKSAAMETMIKADRSWDELRSDHSSDFSSLMKRSDISFKGDEELERLSVSERLDRLKNDDNAQDYGLLSLYWQFGKYLLISSSRAGTLPANLQGVWSDGISAEWNSDYHTNINLQMNYWQAEQANISECTYALFDYMNNYLLSGGKKTARANYGTDGMVVHHISDIYGFTSAGDGYRWGMWPMGGAWLAYHMWEHYLYTGDKEFLKNTAYKYIKENVQFLVGNLLEGKDGYLHTCPSMSPENIYITELDGNRFETHIAMSPTMDIEIVGGLFDFYAEMENILGIDPENGEKVKAIRTRLPPLRVGKFGQLMEWIEDYEEAEPGHRHISHAFALYPAAQITRNTPELYKAVETTIERRLDNGGGHTGWSRAWIINLFARLRNAEKTYENIRSLLTESTLPNLLDTYPPFQIDGNFGGAAGIGEMVMQSHNGCISIIPAIPDFLHGSFTGLRARGGITVSAEWENGKVTSVSLTPDNPCRVTLEIPGSVTMELELNETVDITLT